MSKINLSKIFSNLIEEDRVSPESRLIIIKFKQILSSCKIDVVTNGIEPDQVVETYLRREKSLNASLSEYYGLTEVICAINRTASFIKIANGVCGEYNLTIFFDIDFKLLLGVIIIKGKK